MLFAFILTMPDCGSWNGKWSGNDKFYARVRSVPKGEVESKHLAGTPICFRYRWKDNWEAKVEVRHVSSPEGRQIRKVSLGFFGYEWMIDSILEFGEILSTKEAASRRQSTG